MGWAGLNKPSLGHLIVTRRYAILPRTDRKDRQHVVSPFRPCSSTLPWRNVAYGWRPAAWTKSKQRRRARKVKELVCLAWYGRTFSQWIIGWSATAWSPWLGALVLQNPSVDYLMSHLSNLDAKITVAPGSVRNPRTQPKNRVWPQIYVTHGSRRKRFAVSWIVKYWWDRLVIAQESSPRGTVWRRPLSKLYCRLLLATANLIGTPKQSSPNRRPHPAKVAGWCTCAVPATRGFSRKGTALQLRAPIWSDYSNLSHFNQTRSHGQTSDERPIYKQNAKRMSIRKWVAYSRWLFVFEASRFPRPVPSVYLHFSNPVLRSLRRA